MLCDHDESSWPRSGIIVKALVRSLRDSDAVDVKILVANIGTHVFGGSEFNVLPIACFYVVQREGCSVLLLPRRLPLPAALQPPALCKSTQVLSTLEAEPKWPIDSAREIHMFDAKGNTIASLAPLSSSFVEWKVDDATADRAEKATF